MAFSSVAERSSTMSPFSTGFSRMLTPPGDLLACCGFLLRVPDQPSHIFPVSLHLLAARMAWDLGERHAALARPREICAVVHLDWAERAGGIEPPLDAENVDPGLKSG